MQLSYFLLFCMTNGEKIIRNANIKACKDCVYFKRDGLFGNGFEKCEKFGTKNIVTNEITYEYADACRQNENKCGEYANYFEPENKITKMIKYNIFTSTPYGFIILVSFLCGLFRVPLK